MLTNEPTLNFKMVESKHPLFVFYATKNLALIKTTRWGGKDLTKVSSHTQYCGYTMPKVDIIFTS
jgi:hypothetical protein